MLFLVPTRCVTAIKLAAEPPWELPRLSTAAVGGVSADLEVSTSQGARCGALVKLKFDTPH